MKPISNISSQNQIGTRTSHTRTYAQPSIGFRFGVQRDHELRKRTTQTKFAMLHARHQDAFLQAPRYSCSRLWGRLCSQLPSTATSQMSMVSTLSTCSMQPHASLIRHRTRPATLSFLSAQHHVARAAGSEANESSELNNNVEPQPNSPSAPSLSALASALVRCSTILVKTACVVVAVTAVACVICPDPSMAASADPSNPVAGEEVLSHNASAIIKSDPRRGTAM